MTTEICLVLIQHTGLNDGVAVCRCLSFEILQCCSMYYKCFALDTVLYDVGVFNIIHMLPALFRAFNQLYNYIDCDLLFYTSVSCYTIICIGSRCLGTQVDALRGLNKVLCLEIVPRQVNHTQPQTMNCNVIPFTGID